MKLLSSSQINLLAVAFSQGDELLAAWPQFRETMAEDNISGADYLLLPLISHNLEANQIQDSLVDFLKGTSRYIWCRNQVFKQEITKILLLLKQRQIQPVLIGIGGLSLALYSSDKLMKLRDFLFIVPPSQLKTLKQACLEANFPVQPSLDDNNGNSCPSLFTVITPENIEVSFTSAIQLGENAQLTITDLHPLQTSTCLFNGIELPVLNETYQALYLLSSLNSVMPKNFIDWLANLSTLLNASFESIDWEIIESYLSDNQMIYPLKQILPYLKKLPPSPGLAYFIDLTQTRRLSQEQRIDYFLSVQVRQVSPRLSGKLKYWYNRYAQPWLPLQKI
ncbi:MAG: hypothetical protein AAGG02_02475 [Cyanobacteria bacterium P01_H01_bin.15]